MRNPPLVYDEEGVVDWDLFCAMISDGEKADLIEGVVYMASPDSRRANTMNGFMYSLMTLFMQRRNTGGELFFSRFAFRMSNRDAPEPDIAYVRPERMNLIEEGGMRGPPDIAVEIVAKESRARDWVLKRELYQKYGVEEYWILDYLQQQFEFLRLVEGVYVPQTLVEDHLYQSTVLPGFWIDVQWLLATPLPSTADCLDRILSTSPSP